MAFKPSDATGYEYKSVIKIVTNEGWFIRGSKAQTQLTPLYRPDLATADINERLILLLTS